MNIWGLEDGDVNVHNCLYSLLPWSMHVLNEFTIKRIVLTYWLLKFGVEREQILFGHFKRTSETE